VTHFELGLILATPNLQTAIVPESSSEHQRGEVSPSLAYTFTQPESVALNPAYLWSAY
jgi:hypothetical protein